MAANKNRRYYHACPNCTVKFFSSASQEPCPGCGALLVSRELREMPWEKLETAADLEARYREQQRRLSCPGCGEDPFLG